MARLAVRSLVAAAWLALALPPASAQTATLFRTPTANATDIVFAWAGDLWRVPHAGGDAVRLTTGLGEERDPVFSPDGTKVAFTGEYDGNVDVFVVDAAGGVPTRLTWHPGDDDAVGWTPDSSRVLFASERASSRSFPRLFTVGLDGGLPEALPLPMGERGAYSPDGAQIAYEPLAQWQPAWKRYRGGQTDKIWIAALADSSVVEIPRSNSNDRYPMWIGTRVFFLSDRDGAYTLYAYDTATKAVTRLVDPSDLDLLSASAWTGAHGGAPTIAYEQFGAIHLYDVASGQARRVDIRATADIPTLRPRYEKVGERLTNAGLSPTGARAVFEARGEILTLPAEKGDARNLTRTPGVMERSPAWSPDGRWIAYYSDASGEYALHLRDQRGEGEPRTIPLPPLFYYTPVWSPDSRRLAFMDKALTLWMLDIEKTTPVKVDTNPIGLRDAVLVPAWSLDSHWIAYARQLDNRLRAIFVYSVDGAEARQVTDGMSDAQAPVFDTNGKYLYFTASTNLGPAFSFAEMSTFPHLSSRSVYAAVLSNEDPSPLAPESDEETVEEKDGADVKAAPRPGAKPAATSPAKPGARPASKPDASRDAESDAPRPVRIDFDGIDQRIVALPFPSLDYAGLRAGKAGVVYAIERPVAGPGQPPGPPRLAVHRYDGETRKVEQLIEGVSAFIVSANGEKALIRQGQRWSIKPVGQLGGGARGPGGPGGPDGGGDGTLATDALQVLVDPRVEWAQMFDEVWRGERDFFYDRNLHGVDLDWARSTYRPYLAAVAHRSDLTHLFTEMLNQLTVGHMFIFGGDRPRPDRVPGGLLGADYTIEQGRYRIAKVYTGENWNPELRAPLTAPGVVVRAGDYLLAVDGRDLAGTDNVHARFENTAGRQVRLRVGPSADGTGARDVVVVPVASETALRERDWIESNRRYVDERSNGRLAYVYVPNTGGEGYTNFNRYFFAQTQKAGAVIDERFNQGGALADYIVEYLTRPLLNYIYFRDGVSLPTPLGAIYGPKAMLINELAGSGGDALPWYFRKMQAGPLIGKRTWGGLVASFPAPTLMDGGAVTAPDAAIYGLEGTWEVENVGVRPDIEVDLDPKAWREGRDLQLERAVDHLLDELKRSPSPTHARPLFPTYR